MYYLGEALEYLVALAFFLLGILGARVWFLRRSRQAMWMSLMFGILGFIAAMSLFYPEQGGSAAVEVSFKIAIGVLLLFPYLLYRFSTTFEPSSRRMEIFAATLTAVAIVWPFFLPGIPADDEPLPFGWAVYFGVLVLQWVALSAIMAWRVWHGGRALPRIARRRARLLSVAAVLLSVVMISAGASPSDDSPLVIQNLLTLASAVAFYFGFAPPRFMLTIWRKPMQDALYRGIADLVSAETEEQVSSSLLPHVNAMLGARAVALSDPDGTILESHGMTEAMDDQVPAIVSGGADHASRGILVVPLKFGSVIVWTSRYTPFFGDEELELVRTLGTLAHYALERARSARARGEERERLERQMVQAQKMEAIGHLAGGIAHDFNNLLAIIDNYTAFVIDELDETDAHRADLDEVRKAAARGAALTRQLLTFSRKDVIRPQIVDVGEVVEGLEKMLRRTLSESIDLRVEVAPDRWKTKIDRAELEQVILNMAINARDAMGERGTLCISLENSLVDEVMAQEVSGMIPGAYLCLSVSDDGHGMTKEVVARAFEPFFTTKERGAGTGLGLSTVYGIVKRSGGFISLYSERGLGTTFRVYLPASEEDAIKLDARDGEGLPSARGESILVVEDEQSIRTLVTRILSKHGYQVESAACGDEALTVLEALGGDIDILLSDVVMPGMSGKELAVKVQEIAPEVRILFMSGYTDDIIAKHGILRRGENYLQKPFSADELLREIARVTEPSMAASGDGQR